MLGHHNPVLPEQRPKLPEEQARHGVLREGPVERGGAEGGRGGRTCAQRRPDSSPRYEAAAARLIAGTSRVGQRTGGRRSPAMRRARSGRPSSQLGRLVWSLYAPKSTAEEPRTSEGSRGTGQAFAVNVKSPLHGDRSARTTAGRENGSVGNCVDAIRPLWRAHLQARPCPARHRVYDYDAHSTRLLCKHSK